MNDWKEKSVPILGTGTERTSRIEKKRGVGEAIEGEKGDCEGGREKKG